MGNEIDSAFSLLKRKTVASPEDWPTATKVSSTGDQSKARKAGTLVCVDSTSFSRFLPSNAVTLQSRKVFPVTSTERKRCSAVVEDGAQRMAVSIVSLRLVWTVEGRINHLHSRYL
jgi:hypothetical protein